MGRAITLRQDFDGSELRRLARMSKNAGQSRRLPALSAIYDGGSVRMLPVLEMSGFRLSGTGCCASMPGGPAGLINGKATGPQPKLNDEQRQALARIVEQGPIPAIHGVMRWRRKDLALWLFEEFRISLEESSVGRELRALGFRKITARPRHRGQNEFAVEDFKKLPRRTGNDSHQPLGQHQHRNLVAG